LAGAERAGGDPLSRPMVAAPAVIRSTAIPAEVSFR